MRYKAVPFLNHDPQDTSPQYLEDLATGYWFSEVLFTAVELEIFTLLDKWGKNVETLSREIGLDLHGLERFLNVLLAMGLLVCNGSRFFNTWLASEYLVKGKEQYQGDSILWRKHLSRSWTGLKGCLKIGKRADFGLQGEDMGERTWNYINAMDSVARNKVREILLFFEGSGLEGEILDVGAGSGAIAAGFLNHFTRMRATLIDLPGVIDMTRHLMNERGLRERATFYGANILEAWPVKKGHFDLLILSNIVHAYSEEELPHILSSAVACMKERGFLLIHDFFSEHYPQKAALFDLNMFINTYNGRIFSKAYLKRELDRLKLFSTELIPLCTDTAVIIASKKGENLAMLNVDRKILLASKVRSIGFKTVHVISTNLVHVTVWAEQRCRYGCDRYGRPHCPPFSPSSEKTKDTLKDYSFALLLEGEPPTRTFQRKALEAERDAFRAGFHKAFVYWAGPCSICDSCTIDTTCLNTRDARPSMEGAGIDVFETVRRAGLGLKSLKDRDGFVKYFGLLLLE